MSAPVDVESYVRSFERNTGARLDSEQRAELRRLFQVCRDQAVHEATSRPAIGWGR